MDLAGTEVWAGCFPAFAAESFRRWWCGSSRMCSCPP